MQEIDNISLSTIVTGAFPTIAIFFVLYSLANYLLNCLSPRCPMLGWPQFRSPLCYLCNKLSVEICGQCSVTGGKWSPHRGKLGGIGGKSA